MASNIIREYILRPITARIKNSNTINTNISKFIDLLQASTMDVLELKREIETLSSRLGKTQDYL
ncbi:hypothetical protein [Anabaena sp. CCY 9402-a]|uniref:hypothetical protein n=1 Tax=Anabaena sp. CCY 9402-a TaxID=3103867 RepID=UPI0039C7100D